jgi:predicted aspartyl protease
MPSFTSTLPNLHQIGPIVEIQIVIPRDLAKVLTDKNNTVPNPIKANALIDTGASSSCVNPDVIKGLNVSPIGVTKIHTASHANIDCNQYKLAFQFPNGVTIESAEVIETSLEGQPIQCLIGRDILKYGVLIYSGYMQQITFSV